MDTLKLSSLIGQEISDLRFHYVPENEYGMQSFHAYLKLASDIIIHIPKFDEEDFVQLTQHTYEHFKEKFDTGQPVTNKLKSLIAGQKIMDIYFSYYDNEVDLDSSAFIKLSNDYYLSENNFGPVGVTTIDLIFLNEEDFFRKVKKLHDMKVYVRPISRANPTNPFNS